MASMATQAHSAGTANHPAGHDPRAEAAHHVVSVGVYWRVITALMVLLIITLWAAAIDLGALNLPIAMAIAVIKMVIIMLYFMHVKFSTRLVKVFAGAAFFWLSILFALTLMDYLARYWLTAFQI